MNIKIIYKLLKSYLKDPEHLVKNITWRFPKTIDSQRIIFVMGAPRSGTTLLQNIISGHDQICSIEGETGIFTNQNLFIKSRRHFGHSDDEIQEIMSQSVDIIDFFSKGARLVSQKNDDKIFLEKTPQHILYLELLIKHFPNAQFVHIVRDGRDVISSARKHPDIQTVSLNHYAKYWKKCVSVPMGILNSPRVYTVKYEELTNDPRVEVEKIMDFLSLPFQENQIEPKSFGADKRSEQIEFKRLKTSISTKSVKRWKDELTKNEKQEFLDIASQELEYYGYIR